MIHAKKVAWRSHILEVMMRETEERRFELREMRRMMHRCPRGDEWLGHYRMAKVILHALQTNVMMLEMVLKGLEVAETEERAAGRAYVVCNESCSRFGYDPNDCMRNGCARFR